ncbi:hypothetical protein [Paludisphaera mucosa]|uniref:Uncharacterized protein n=1 Tax=Paludisphaera mucosa TaxID=3030827 RepID=A0ABT6FBM9_9BACT|nr:hypothetical protein [Paludisphaera mucosa]MDG3004849.1 hypothetical protein [Paludisphaera mucosa]
MQLSWTKTFPVWWSLAWRTSLLAVLFGAALGAVVAGVLGARGYTPEEVQASIRRYNVPLAGSIIALATILAVKLTLKKHLPTLVDLEAGVGPAAIEPSTDVSWNQTLTLWWSLLWRCVLMLIVGGYLCALLLGTAMVAKGYDPEEIRALVQRYMPLAAYGLVATASIAAVKLALPKHLAKIGGLVEPEAAAVAGTSLPRGLTLAVWWGLLWRGFLVAVPVTLVAGLFVGVVFASKGYSFAEFQAALRPLNIPFNAIVVAIASIAAVRMVLKKLPTWLSGREEAAEPPSWERTLAVWWGLAWRTVLLAMLLGFLVGGILGGVLAARGYTADEVRAFLGPYVVPLGCFHQAISLIAAVKLVFPQYLASLDPPRSDGTPNASQDDRLP